MNMSSQPFTEVSLFPFMSIQNKMSLVPCMWSIHFLIIYNVGNVTGLGEGFGVTPLPLPPPPTHTPTYMPVVTRLSG